MNHLMIDLETMGNNSYSPILSIGAVYFDEKILGSGFYVNIDLEESLRRGFKVDAGTIKWWMNQSKEAKDALGVPKPIGLEDALQKFTSFIRSSTILWGNGANFDNVILKNAYRVTGLPWRLGHRSNRCFRTLFNIFPTLTELPKVTVKHHAFEDAKWQAEYMVRLCKEYNITLR